MIVLQYNPYEQTAKFQNLNEENGKTSDLINLSKDQKDALNMLKKDIILQNQIEKLIDVLKEIDSSQRFSFIGTGKDYEDFSEGVRQLAPGGVVEKTDSQFFYEATVIREQLRSIFDAVFNKVIALNQKYPEYCNILHFDSTGIDAALNDRTPLVFIGKGSTGKSSVINALIGAEVLPTGDGTTTEAVCEIIPDEDRFEVSYRYSNSVCKLDFNKSKEDAELSLKNAFGIEVDLNTENQYDWVYQAVELINKQEEITNFQVRIPFKNFTDKNLTETLKQIVIYDTPGPDSKTRVNHKNVLNEALSHFTKGVAVFVTSPTEIEKTNLRSFLKEYTENATELLEILNVNAGIVIINGADKSNLDRINMGKKSRKEHLQKGKDDVTRLEFQFEEDRRIYFSSPYALGIHKEQGAPWMDSVFKKVNRHSECMDTPGDDDYLPLATVAELPFLRQKAVRDEYQKAEQRYKNDKSEDNRRELIAHNSGLRALENEIGFVVNELSICNLCAQAQKQLKYVLQSIQHNTDSISDEVSNKKKEYDLRFKQKYRGIVEELFGDQQTSVWNTALADVDKYVLNAIGTEDCLIESAREGIKQAILKQWSEVKRDPNGKIKDIILNNQILGDIQKKRNSEAVSFYNKQFYIFRDRCRQIVYENKQLTREEKNALQDCMEKWTVVKFDTSKVRIDDNDYIKKILVVFRFADKNKCCDTVARKIERLLRDQKLIVKNTVRSCFKESCNNAKSTFFTEERIKAVNPELKELSEQIAKLESQQKEYGEFQEKVNEYLTIVQKLTQLQKKGTVL